MRPLHAPITSKLKAKQTRILSSEGQISRQQQKGLRVDGAQGMLPVGTCNVRSLQASSVSLHVPAGNKAAKYRPHQPCMPQSAPQALSCTEASVYFPTICNPPECVLQFRADHEVRWLSSSQAALLALSIPNRSRRHAALCWGPSRAKSVLQGQAARLQKARPL